MRYVTILLAATILAVTLCLPGHARAQTSDAVAIDNAFKQGWMTGNLDAVFTLYAPDVIASVPFGTFTDRASFRAGVDAFLKTQPGASASFGESAFVFSTSVSRTYFSSDPLKALGISRIVIVETRVVRDGKIVSHTGLMDLTDAETARFAAASGSTGAP
jgi:hypothetical protein